MIWLMVPMLGVLVATCAWAAVVMYRLERDAKARGVKLPSIPFPIERPLSERPDRSAGWTPDDVLEAEKLGIKL